MNTTVSVREFSHHMSKYLRKLKPGERIVVTDHNVPVADVIPHQGAQIVPSWKKPFTPIKIKGEPLSVTIVKERQKARG